MKRLNLILLLILIMIVALALVSHPCVRKPRERGPIHNFLIYKKPGEIPARRRAMNLTEL